MAKHRVALEQFGKDILSSISLIPLVFLNEIGSIVCTRMILLVMIPKVKCPKVKI